MGKPGSLPQPLHDGGDTDSVSVRFVTNGLKRDGFKRACAHCRGVAESLKKCTGCKLTFYCNATCQRAHWSTRHKWVCALVRMLSDQGASETPVDEFTVSAFNRINIGTRVVDDGVAGRGLETTSAVVKGTILALFVHTKAPVNSMELFRYSLSSSACIVDRPDVLPDALNGSLANDAATEAQLRALCDPPDSLSLDSISKRVAEFAGAYSANATLTKWGAQVTGTARIVPAAVAGLSFNGAVLMATRDLPAGSRLLWHYGICYWLHMAAADCMPWPVHPLVRWYINMFVLRGSHMIAFFVAHGIMDPLMLGNAKALEQINWSVLVNEIVQSKNLGPGLPAWIHFETRAPGMYSCVYGSPEYEGLNLTETSQGSPFLAVYPSVTWEEMTSETDETMSKKSDMCASLLIKSIWPHGYTVILHTGAIVHAYNRRADDAVYPQDVLEHLFTQMVEFVRCSSTDDISNPEEARVAMQYIVYLVIEEKVTSRPPVA